MDDCIEIYRVSRKEQIFAWRRKNAKGKIIAKSDGNFSTMADTVRSAESLNKDIPRQYFKVERGLKLS